MRQLVAIKCRMYPTKEQTHLLGQFFGAKRWIYNHFLSKQKELYAKEKKHLSHFDMNYAITRLKGQEDTGWLRQVDAILLQNATEDLATAYKNFFDSIKGKRKGKKSELPRFKKRSNLQSYRTRNVKVSETGIKLPKFKQEIAVVWHRNIPDMSTVKSATISKTPSGKYFISVLIETDIELKSMASREVGIDLGIKDLIITSDGVKFVNPNIQLAKTKQLLKKCQNQLAKKKKGSKNYEHVRLRVAKLHEKIVNFKRNYYHNISAYLISNYDSIYMEDLNVSGMLKNRKLSRAIHESSWSILQSMIEYKCNWYGKTFHKISRWTPTSKTCSCCGHKMADMSLGIREWTCPICDTSHDRDINAAMNIRHKGQMDLYGRLLSDATTEKVEIPKALVKMTSKIERSSSNELVGHGTEQA